jgi:hypothetical protein
MSTAWMTGDINLMGVADADEPFRRVSGLMGEADAVFANLECALYSPPAGQPPRQEGFYADPVIGLDVLRRGNIAAVGIANNVNFGEDPIISSIAALDAGGILHSGAGANLEAARKGVIAERGGCRYGFLQRSSVFWPNDHAASGDSPGIAVLPGHTAYEIPMYRFDTSITSANRPGIPPKIVTWPDREYLDGYLDDIRRLRPEVDILIVSCHWGFRDQVLDYMQQIAHAVIEAGADVVMGHGPHMPLPIELYRGKPIFYGLGSFSFHTGHRGRAGGNWLGLIGCIGRSNAEKTASIRLVRHNDQNETVLRHPDDEIEPLFALTSRSLSYGTRLEQHGDEVLITPA